MVSHDCHLQDLKLILKKTLELEFDTHEDVLIGVSYPDLMQKSFIVTLLISLDSEMSRFCADLKAYTNQAMKANELKGSSFERFLKYAEKICGLDTICDESLKQKVKGLIELRNCIVHNDSQLEGFGKANVIKIFSQQVNGLTVEDGVIELIPEACIECADIASKLMTEAYHSAMDKLECAPVDG